MFGKLAHYLLMALQSATVHLELNSGISQTGIQQRGPPFDRSWRFDSVGLEKTKEL